MATSPIASTPIPATAAAGLKLDDLLRVLLTELTHQDPFKPTDNKDFIAQVAQFTTLQSSQQLNDNIVQLVTLQALNQSVGLIGHRVSARTEGGSVTGTVTALTLDNGVPRLTIEAGSGQILTGIALGELETVRQ